MSRPHISRRQFLVYSGGALVLAGCGAGHDMSAMGSGSASTSTPPGTRPRVGPTDPSVHAAERGRSGGDVVSASLLAQPFTFDLAGRAVNTWAFNDQIAGPLLRAKVGQELEVKLANRLPEPTTIHWHGLALRNDMDGVEDMTQPGVAPNADFTYRFKLAHPGTYWFHPHTGLQLDRGLYAPLIIDDPSEPGDYDAEIILVIDDWLDGFGSTPEDVLRELTTMDHSKMGDMGGTGTSSTTPTTMTGDMGGMNHTGMNMGMTPITPISYRNEHAAAGSPGGKQPGRALMGAFESDALGGDAGDVSYPLHLINGKPPADRPTFDVPRGRVRIRLINAGSDTAYRFAIGGHKLQVTHTDGYPTEPLEVDTIILGMGERYDVIVDVQSGAWPIVAVAEGKDAVATAVLRTTDAAVTDAPPIDARPSQLGGQLLKYTDLRATRAVAMNDFRPVYARDRGPSGGHVGRRPRSLVARRAKSA